MKVLVNFSPTYLHLVFKSGTLQSRINVSPTFINFVIGQEKNPKNYRNVSIDVKMNQNSGGKIFKSPPTFIS